MTNRLPSLSLAFLSLAVTLPSIGLAQLASPAKAGFKAAAEDSSYEIYFSLGSTKLSAAARKMIRQAAETATKMGATKILVVGHADSIGSDERNLDLSRQRARAVMGALTAYGVQAGIIELDWKGEFEPAVPTPPDGVSRLSRRVTVILQSS